MIEGLLGGVDLGHQRVSVERFQRAARTTLGVSPHVAREARLYQCSRAGLRELFELEIVGKDGTARPTGPAGPATKRQDGRIGRINTSQLEVCAA